mgnify:CR=1 FL=1
MKNILYILIFILISCELPDNDIAYQESLVVFGRIELFETNGIAIGEIDTVRVSLSSQIDADLENANQLYINDAEVTLTGIFSENESDTITITLFSLNNLSAVFIDLFISFESPSANSIANSL